jgi:2,4-dienoyl-CoA reductase-like NADH-dependent reductase (Old Yellow Enzyme family)
MHEDGVIEHLQTFSSSIHAHGAATLVQLSHMGRRTRWDSGDWLVPVSPSPKREHYSRSVAREVEDWDIRRIVKDFGQAARRAKEGGMDGIEVMAAVQHLIDQFWSPSTNQRTDAYGGSLENRMRFSLEVLDEIRAQTGEGFIVGIRVSGDEMLAGGLSAKDCLNIVKRLTEHARLDYISVHPGQLESMADYARFLPGMAVPSSAYLYMASAFKAELDLPILHATRIADVGSAARAIEDGHVDLVGMTRAQIADPHLVRKLAEGRVDDIRPCVGASFCLSGRGATCIHNPSAGREQSLPHLTVKASLRRRIVVIGGGVAGLESARVCAERGHEVLLIEQSNILGGQVNIAAKCSWRESLANIPRWLEGQVRKMGVEIRLSQAAAMADITAWKPDSVVIATGGLPNLTGFEGSEYATSTWDILDSKVPLGKRILLWDDAGFEAGISCAQFAAARGSLVEMVTYDHYAAQEVPKGDRPIYLQDAYLNDVVFSGDLKLLKIFQENGSLVGVFENVYSKQTEERVADQIIVEQGVAPSRLMYEMLRPLSRNLGEVDINALVSGSSPAVLNNPEGQFDVYCVGDTVAGRSIYAAILDARRLCQQL